jgi:hypothetical protein
MPVEYFPGLQAERPLVLDVLFFQRAKPVPEIQDTSDNDSYTQADSEKEAVRRPSDDEDEHHCHRHDEAGASSPREPGFGISHGIPGSILSFFRERGCKARKEKTG